MNSLIRSAIISTFRPAAAAGAATDTNFANTVLLLHGDGTNGAQNQTFLDSGTANTGGTGFTITRNGNTTQGTFSPFSQTGWSNYFDGTGDYLSTADSISLGSGDFTVGCWVYLNATGAEMPVVCSPNYYRSGYNGNFVMRVGTSNLYNSFDGQSSGTDISGTYSWEKSIWTYVAWVRSGSTITVYKNGTSLGTVNSSRDLSDSSNGLYIAVNRINNAIQSDNLNGYISNLRILVGTADTAVPTAPFTAITNTKLLTCQSNRFVDENTQVAAKTITVNGDTSVQAFSPFNPTAAYSAATNGGSGYFDGTTDYLQVADNNALDFGTGDFTVEGWYYSTAATTTLQTVFSVGRYDSGVFLRIGTHPGGDSFYINGTNYNWDPTTYFKSYQWNHVVVARTGTTVGIFVNGTRVFNTTNSNNIVPTTSTTIAGATHDLSGLFFTGYINGFRIIKGSGPYDATSSTLTVPTAPLTAITNTSLLCNFTNAGIIDSTAKNVLETVGNAQIDTGTKKFGTGSLEFDGTGDYLKSPNSPNYNFGSGDFTIEFWMYTADVTPSVAAWFVAMFQSSSGQNSWGVRLETDGSLVGYLSSDGGESPTTITASTPGLSDNTWHHIAFVRNGSGSNNMTLYVDGTSKVTGTFSSALFNSNLPVTVGIQNNTSFNQYFNGFIDDLRITKGVARYTANFTPPTTAFSDL